MKQQYFEINLLQPLIISQTAASAGAHQSLDYIPGSLLLGLVASRLYTKLSTQQAWDVFHSGLIRFGDALPCVSSGETCYPVPLCWHHFKGEQIEENNKLQESRIFDVSKQRTEQLKTKQPVQLRAMYITTTGQKFVPSREQTLKTAIDPNSGIAAESQLFGYEALTAGQILHFCVSAPDDMDQELWTQITTAIGGSAQLGRSRSAQFGKVYIKPIATQEPKKIANVNDILTLWLLSDLLLSRQGQPCLIPDPELMGLPQGTTWIVEQSFIRTRRYSLYNAYRRHYDRERQVICRGSILRYQLPNKKIDIPTVVTALSQGIGLAQEHGLGHVWINPPLLAQCHPHFEEAALYADQITAPSPSRPSQSLLIQCLDRRKNALEQTHDPIKKAEEIFMELCQKVTQARRYLAVAENTPLPNAPSRTQFGRFKELANNHRNQQGALWKELTDEKNGVLRGRSGWELAFSPDAEHCLGKWLISSLKEHKDQTWFPLLVGKLAALGLSETWQKYCMGEKKGVTV